MELKTRKFTAQERRFDILFRIFRSFTVDSKYSVRSPRIESKYYDISEKTFKKDIATIKAWMKSKAYIDIQNKAPEEFIGNQLEKEDKKRREARFKKLSERNANQC